MRKGLLALAITATLTAGAGGVAAGAVWAADDAGDGMHAQMASMDASSMDMANMDMRSMAGMDMRSTADMHTPEMDAMHTEMLAQMPEETRAACDEMHTQMTAAAGTGPAEHSAHHDQ